MSGNYEKSIYNQLMEIMARMDSVEKELQTEKREHKEDVDRLNAKIDSLTQENQILKDDNARLKSIINNDSSNSSLPPSTDQKGTKPANTYNGRTPGLTADSGGTSQTILHKNLHALFCRYRQDYGIARTGSSLGYHHRYGIRNGRLQRHGYHSCLFPRYFSGSYLWSRSLPKSSHRHGARGT